MKFLAQKSASQLLDYLTDPVGWLDIADEYRGETHVYYGGGAFEMRQLYNDIRQAVTEELGRRLDGRPLPVDMVIG